MESIEEKRRGRRKWLIALAALFVGGSGVAGAHVAARRITPPPVPVPQIQEALNQADGMPGLSLPLVDQGVVTIADGLARVDVTVPPWECLLALVGGATPRNLDSVTLYESESREPLVVEHGSRMVDLGWCAADEPLPLTIWARGRTLFEEDLTDEGEGSVVYRFHVGEPSGRWRAYIAGNLADGEKLSALTAAWRQHLGEARDAAEAPGGEPLFRQDVGPDEALVLPLSPSTRWAARALPAVGRPDREYDPRLTSVAGTGRGTQRPLALVDDRFRRLLAVVDPSDLPVDGPVPCVRVHLSRVAAQTGQASRLTIPALEETVGLDHRLCPGDPLTAFVADPEDAADWRIRVLPAEGPTAPRSATAPPAEPLVGPTHRRALEGCQAGDYADCADASRHLATGRYVAADSAEANRLGNRACQGEAEHCGAYGSFLSDQGDPVGAFAAWSRGCHMGNDGWACATLGEAYRLGEGHAFDPASAKAAYEKACRLGIQRACDRVATMDLLQLGG